MAGARAHRTVYTDRYIRILRLFNPKKSTLLSLLSFKLQATADRAKAQDRVWVWKFKVSHMTRAVLNALCRVSSIAVVWIVVGAS
jgi:hypothetical protein